MLTRLIGAAFFGTIGFIVGAGSGIVGGLIGATAGAGIFTTIGVFYGFSAGPDAVRIVRWIRGRFS